MTVTLTITAADGATEQITLPAPTIGAAWPDATNTGVPSGTTLTPSGYIETSSNGQIISALDITGGISINHNNVTVQNCKIHDASTSDNQVIYVTPGTAGTLIEHCEIYGAGSGMTLQNAGIYLVNGAAISCTIDSCNIHTVGHGIDVQCDGGPIVIKNCYIHDLLSNAGSHYDCVYHGGSGSTNFSLDIEHNTFDNRYTQTSTIFVENYFGDIRNITVNNNRLLMPNGTYNCECNATAGNGAGGAFISASYTNNRMSLPAGDTDYLDSRNCNPVWSGNVDDVTGSPI